MPKKKWSAAVTEHSDAMDLKKGVFTSGSPKKIAQSVERSAATSKRKKGNTRQSAMSMLNFYINRAGKNLSASKKKTLERAKEILHDMHGSAPAPKKPAAKKQASRRKRTAASKRS